MQDQIEYLRAELQRKGETYAEEARRKDTIIAQLAQRIPQLPQASSPESRGDPEAAPDSTDRGEIPPEPQEHTQRRSWLYRFFFGPG